MPIVDVHSSWPAGGDQCLDELLHINRLLAEDGETCLQSTVLRPDNASGSERCLIMLTAHSSMALTELRIVCSARHMEVYEGKDSYLETVKGKMKSSNGSSVYWHTFECGRPLDTMSIKFVSLQEKQKLDLFGIWLTLEEKNDVPDSSKLVNMQKVDRMLLNNKFETDGQAMLHQLISSIPASAPSSTPQSQTNPLLPMMLQLFTQRTMSQQSDSRQTETNECLAKQLLCKKSNRDKSNTTSDTVLSIECRNDKWNLVESQEEKCSTDEFSKEGLNNCAVSASESVTCSCGVNLEARVLQMQQEMEERLQAKFQEMDDYRLQMDKKFEILENKCIDLLKEKNSSNKDNT
ncbi:uncharacterized protein [Antedon mediterranea]|uniref:uncharacterized protein n=1 Tax=Antedon mediterranea TaxID=105859 RepID=UPI003AF668F6